MVLALALSLGCSDHTLNPMAGGSGGDGPHVLVTPEVLDFGTLTGEDEAVLQSFQIVSTGTQPLTLHGVTLQDGDYASFALVTDVEPMTLEPGETLDVEVAFFPYGANQVALAKVITDDPDLPSWPVELSGHADVPELEVDPDPLNHGDIGVGCDRQNTATLTSVGGFDITLETIAIEGDGFSLLSSPVLPMTLAPGESTTVEIEFIPSEQADYEGALVVTSDEAMGTRKALQLGSGVVDGKFKDEWKIPAGDPPSDIVFSVDASCSMTSDMWKLAGDFDTFINQLENYSNDWRIIVASNDDGCNSTGILTPNTPNYEQVFADNILWGGFFADWTEALLTINVNAIENTDSGECNQNFLRPNAMLHIIDVTDEPEQSVEMGGATWDENVQRLWNKKGSAALVRVSAIAGPVPNGCGDASPATGYAEAVAATGGVFLSICDDWASANNLKLLAEASVNQSNFELSNNAVESTILVTVNGSERWDWTFDTARNTVVFDGDFPAGGDQVVIKYMGVGACD